MTNSLCTQPFDLMQYFFLSSHDPVIRALLRLGGRIEPETLKRAVDLSAHAVPQVRCCFSKILHSWEDRGFTAEQIVRVEDDSEETGLAEKKLLETLDLFSAPHLKIYVVRGKSADTLCIIISHLVTDGAGFRQYLYLLAECYSACATGRKIQPILCDRSLRQVTKRFHLCDRLKILTSPLHYGKRRHSVLLPLEGKKGDSFCTLRTIGPQKFQAMRDYARKKNATLNDLLMTAYLRACHGITRGGELTIPCPVDLRKYSPESEKEICNLTSNYTCRLSVEKGENFEETLRKVTPQMQAQKNSTACLKGPMLLEFLFHVLPFPVVERMFYKMFYIPPISYTNLGILKAERLRFGEITVRDAYLTTAVKRSPNFQVSVSTFEGKCVLSSNLNGTEHDRRVVEELFDRMMTELEPLVP